MEVDAFTRKMLDQIVYMAPCQPLYAKYMGVREPLCDGARRAIDTMFLASFIAAVLLLPLVPLGLQGLKHARQRLRDARHPWLNVLVMFDFKLFSRVRYMREKEVEQIREIEALGVVGGEVGGQNAHATTHALAHKYTTYGEELVFVKIGKGVDGWGHEASHGVISPNDYEPLLFPGVHLKHDLLASCMLKGPSEKAGLHNSALVSRLDKSGLFDAKDTRQLDMDPRTGKLRWLHESEVRTTHAAVTVEDAMMRLYAALCANGEPADGEMAQMINALFRKIDDDASGAVAKPELKAALEEMGMHPSNDDVNKLMKAYDTSGEGLLDLPDFRSLILSALDIGRNKRSAPDTLLNIDTSLNISTGPSQTMLTKSGRRSVAVCCSTLQCVAVCAGVLQCVAVCCSVLQCVAVCCSVLQCVAVYCSVLQCVAVYCSVLQCVAVCCCE